MTNYYDIEDILHLADGVTRSTVNTWSLKLRDTHMVLKHKGRIIYTDDFLSFIKTRIGQLGPSTLPELDTIAELYLLWNKHHNLNVVANVMLKPIELIKKWAKDIGIDYEQEERKG